jgi:hypothetical protein
LVGVEDVEVVDVGIGVHSGPSCEVGGILYIEIKEKKREERRRERNNERGKKEEWQRKKNCEDNGKYACCWSVG